MKTKGHIVIVCFALMILLLCQACYPPGTPKKVKEEYIAAMRRDERPMKFTFRMVDQDGVGAKDYRFKASFNRLHRFLGLFPYARVECHHVTTDENGYVRIDSPGKKASSISFKESNIDRYIFSKELDKNPTWSMPKLTDVATPVEFKVIRHGPPEKLQRINIYAGDIDAKRNNIISVNLRTGTIEEDEKKGDLNIIVKNASLVSRAAESYQNRLVDNIHKGIYRAPADNSSIEWSVSLESHHSFAFKEASNEFSSYAPTKGYIQHQSWKCIFKRDRIRSLSKYFYLKNNNTGRYSWMVLGVGIGFFNDLSIGVRGHTNPNGSKNLYIDKWPLKDAFRQYSKRCP